MIVDIALGIVLAVVLLAFLPLLVAAAASALGLALAIGGIVGAGALLVYLWHHTSAEELKLVVGTILVLGGFVFATNLIEKHTKVTGQEFMGLCLSVPATIYVTIRLTDALTSSPRNDEAIGPLGFGLMCCIAVLAYIVRNVARRYRAP
jgi:hypothetical protein